MVRLHLRRLELPGVTRGRLTLRVHIHETADAKAAERYWAQILGVDASALSKATLKRHNPRTSRKNTGEEYQGCPAIYVRRSAELYRRMEGAWYGIVGGGEITDPE